MITIKTEGVRIQIHVCKNERWYTLVCVCLTSVQLLEYTSGLTALSWYSILQTMMTQTQMVDRQEAMGLKRVKGSANDHSTTNTKFITDGYTVTERESKRE